MICDQVQFKYQNQKVILFYNTKKIIFKWHIFKIIKNERKLRAILNHLLSKITGVRYFKVKQAIVDKFVEEVIKDACLES